jgi:hypothetical protein
MPIAQRTGEQAPFSAGWETRGNRPDSPNHKKNQKNTIGRKQMTEIKTPKDVVNAIKKEGIEVVDLRFMDFPGLWQHFSIPAREIEKTASRAGLALTARASGDGRPLMSLTCW